MLLCLRWNSVLIAMVVLAFKFPFFKIKQSNIEKGCVRSLLRLRVLLLHINFYVVHKEHAYTRTHTLARIITHLRAWHVGCRLVCPVFICICLHVDIMYITYVCIYVYIALCVCV